MTASIILVQKCLQVKFDKNIKINWNTIVLHLNAYSF